MNLLKDAAHAKGPEGLESPEGRESLKGGVQTTEDEVNP
jgi:hypothetical protein